MLGEFDGNPRAPAVRGEGRDRLFGLDGFGDCVAIGTDADRCVG